MAETKRRTTPVRLREPQTVPISDEDYRQAVTALAMMIHQWWANEQSAGMQDQRSARRQRSGRPQVTTDQTARLRTADTHTTGP